MCGFVGAFGPSAQTFKNQLSISLDTIAHRGPDSEGSYCSPERNCVLGHRRLAILDLTEAAHQPMKRLDGVLVFNGQVYNHKQLRNLIPSQHSYLSHGDTETLCVGFRQQGLGLLNDALGMFAGAYYDETKQELHLFRDPLGIKPLYYAELPDSTIVFSSEIKGIFSLVPALSRDYCMDAIKSYMTFENIPQGKSLFREISLLEPGVLWKLSVDSSNRLRSGISRISCVRKEDGDYSGSYDDITKQTRFRVEESVKSHLLSDVPLGLYLSGGIDSSIVATVATKHCPDLMAFTGYFQTQNQYYDERPVARSLAESLGLKLEEVCIEPEDFCENLDSIIYALDEPRMGMGSFSQYMVAHRAGKHRKVILAGHGGDELFAGYPLFKGFWLMQNGLLSMESLKHLFSIRAKEWPWVLNLLLRWIKTGNVEMAPELYDSALKEPLESEYAQVFRQKKSKEPLRQLSSYYKDTYLPGLLIVEDKISMAHSLETRVPLWNQWLVDWVSQIPLGTLMRKGHLKGLLREAFKESLPQAVLSAPKRGFPTPLRLWFRGVLKEFIYDRLLSRSSLLHDLVLPAEINSLLESHWKRPLPFALDERRAHRIWILLCLESWIRQFKVSLKKVG